MKFKYIYTVLLILIIQGLFYSCNSAKREKPPCGDVETAFNRGYGWGWDDGYKNGLEDGFINGNRAYADKWWKLTLLGGVILFLTITTLIAIAYEIIIPVYRTFRLKYLKKSFLKSAKVVGLTEEQIKTFKDISNVHEYNQMVHNLLLNTVEEKQSELTKINQMALDLYLKQTNKLLSLEKKILNNEQMRTFIDEIVTDKNISVRSRYKLLQSLQNT